MIGVGMVEDAQLHATTLHAPVSVSLQVEQSQMNGRTGEIATLGTYITVSIQTAPHGSRGRDIGSTVTPLGLLGLVGNQRAAQGSCISVDATGVRNAFIGH